jgi:hypothetical protein
MPILIWDGRGTPEELRSLPPGKYVIERIDEVPELTEAEQAGLVAAISSLQQGKGIESDEVRRRIGAALKR